MRDGYEALSKRYDKLMYDVSYGQWEAYVSSLLRGDEQSVLEYACGTGSLTLLLSRRGLDITAIDNSAEMLDVAQKKLRSEGRQVRLACADMSDFRLNRQVDAAICACDGVNYITDTDRLASFFRNAGHNLKPGGVFLFDVSSRYKLREIIGDDFFYDDGEEETLLWQNEYDDGAHLLTMELTLFLKAGGLYERYDETHVQRAWVQDELAGALAQAGFSEIETFAFPGIEPVDEKAERIQFKAVKG